MRKTLLSLLLLFPAAPALAGEERSCAGFERLTRSAAKIVVGRVSAVQRHDDERGKFKIVEIETLDAWKGAAAGERIRVLVFERVVHGGDPEAEGKHGNFLAYLAPVPPKPAFRKFGEGLFQPVSGESALIALGGAEGVELLAAARAALDGPLSADLLLAQLESGSARVRESALASLVARAAVELRPHGARLAAKLAQETRPAAQADLIQVLAKTGSADAIDPLLAYALDRPGVEEMLPIAAEALNRIDAAESVRRLELRAPASGERHARALSLLGRLDSPQAIRALLERVRAERLASDAGGTALTLEPLTSDPVALMRAGSLDEKKAAAYQLLRWGTPEQKRLVREESKIAADPSFRRFLEKLLREPFRPFAEL